MSKIKTLLDVVQDMHALADSIEAYARMVEGNAPMEREPIPPEAADGQPDERPAAQPIAQSADPKHAEPKTAKPQNAEPQIDIVAVRAFVAERSTPANRPKIKAILAKFGVAKLTELKPEQYKPLMEEVAAI